MKEIQKMRSQIKDTFITRNINESDWSILVSWWKWWRWTIMPKGFLPENGTGGIMIEKNNIPIIAGFLYETNSDVLILEWVVSNPKYKEKDRKEAVELLIKEAENRAKQLNYKYMFSVGRSKHLINTHEKLGWKIDKKPSHEITKKLILYIICKNHSLLPKSPQS